MQNFLTVMGMVIKSEPIGEYDRRMVILTKERGKISVFARGARKPNSPFSAPSNPFTFGNFKLFVGRNSYSLEEVEVINYFASLRSDMKSAIYGMYFLEIADYYGRENNDEAEMLKLLYQSVAKLEAKAFPEPLIRAVYEIKVIMVNGEFRGIKETEWQTGTQQAIQFLQSSPIEGIFSFKVNDEIRKEMIAAAKKACDETFDRAPFTALTLIEESNWETE